MTLTLALLLAGCRSATQQPSTTTGQPAQPPAGAAAQPSMSGVTIGERTTVPGYQRGCGPHQGCVFGPAWSDDVDVAQGHDGCDTRANQLATQLQQVEIKPGTHGCVVQRGVLHDPYTGAIVTFDRSVNSGQVQVDHVYPLAAAWDHGASVWSSQQRRNFANDPDNLIVTLASVNQSKGDRTPGEWMPPQGRCRYATAYATVAARYALTVSAADDHALEQALQSCS